jgi:hypothetical protein
MVPTKWTRSAELPFSNADTSQLGRMVRVMYRQVAYYRHRFEEQNWDTVKVLGRSLNMCGWDHGSSKFFFQINTWLLRLIHVVMSYFTKNTVKPTQRPLGNSCHLSRESSNLPVRRASKSIL